MSPVPMHKMIAVAGGSTVTRCGAPVKQKGGAWTAWESLVTCAACKLSAAEESQKTLDVMLSDVFGGTDE